MRLLGVTLHGFKSFCDRSVVRASEGMVGIVGPNGSGKSNIIDALRWGLGESRASSLRGGALQDVLFSGSSRRPAADWCMVETTFSAEEKDDLGMWSGTPEIAVRRELGRDGQSYFYINNQSVRRRDVVDLFRGTGVSPRSYAVVEQGMVGSIAEASPDDLRMFLEETAGVSHYKDRRRDAERRLANCQANIEQLEQLLAESRKRTDSLKRQARTAERHREMSDTINAMEAFLLMQDRTEAATLLKAKEQEIAELTAKIEALRKQLESLRQQTENEREQYDNKQREAQASESEWMRVQAAGEKLRMDYEQAEEKRAQLRERLEADKAEEEAIVKATQDAAKAREEALKELEGIGGELEQCISEAEQHADELESLQQTQRQSEATLEEARQSVSSAVQQRETARVQLRMAEEQHQTLSTQLENMQKSLSDGDNTQTSDDAESAAQAGLRAATAAASEAEAEMQVCEQNVAETKASAEVAREQWRNAETTYAAAEAAHQTLQSLASDNDEWTGKDGEVPKPKRLAEVLQAEAGEWSRALDAALGRYAGAFAAESLDDFLRDYGMPPSGTSVVDLQIGKQNSQDSISPTNREGWKSLYSLVRVPTESQQLLAVWLRGIYAADDEESARRQRSDLAVGEMLITREGTAFVRDAVFAAGEVRGGFDWQQQLSVAKSALEKSKVQSESAKQLAITSEEQAATAQAAQQSAAAALSAAQSALAESRVLAGQHEERQRAAQMRGEEIRADIAQIKTQLNTAQQQMQQRQSELGEGGAHASACQKAESALASAQQKHDSLAHQIEECRGALHQSTIRRRELHVRDENLKQQIESLATRDKESAARKKMLEGRIVRSGEELAQMGDAELNARMRQHKEELRVAEENKNAITAVATAAAKKVRDTEQMRECELQRMQSLQEENTQRQVDKGHVQSKVEGLDNSLEDYAIDEEQMAALRADGLDAQARREEIIRLREKRDRLGAINFIAAQELSEAVTRTEGMQLQLQDIETAVSELQGTIRRIDDETRTRLREVFAGVNHNFGEMFQSLFGGGEAELTMDGESILDARFEIRARLPGKRMFPVRMLSGGEKTATALAFIFTLMKLTPPPFCIMDEVDAALDDARVGAFVKLLGDMSKDFQCLVVTHNKFTIESMPRLVGITQEEKGVSKVVSVTLSEALRAVD